MVQEETISHFCRLLHVQTGAYNRKSRGGFGRRYYSGMLKGSSAIKLLQAINNRLFADNSEEAKHVMSKGISAPLQLLRPLYYTILDGSRLAVYTNWELPSLPRYGLSGGPDRYPPHRKDTKLKFSEEESMDGPAVAQRTPKVRETW